MKYLVSGTYSVIVDVGVSDGGVGDTTHNWSKSIFLIKKNIPFLQQNVNGGVHNEWD